MGRLPTRQPLQYWRLHVTRVFRYGQSDLVEQIAISADDGSRQASEWGTTHLTISAKTAVNVDGMFALLLAIIKKKTQA